MRRAAILALVVLGFAGAMMGQTYQHFPIPNAAAQITTGSDGALWFGEYYTGNLARIDTAGNYSSYPNLNVGGNPIIGGPDGNLWFGTNFSQVVRLDPSTGASVSYQRQGPASMLSITASNDG